MSLLVGTPLDFSGLIVGLTVMDRKSTGMRVVGDIDGAGGVVGAFVPAPVGLGVLVGGAVGAGVAFDDGAKVGLLDGGGL